MERTAELYNIFKIWQNNWMFTPYIFISVTDIAKIFPLCIIYFQYILFY